MIFTSIIITISSILTYFQMHGTNEYLDRTIKDTISETLDSLEDKINLSIESKVDVSKSVIDIYENLLEGESPLSKFKDVDVNHLSNVFQLFGYADERTGEIITNDPNFKVPTGFDPRTRSWYLNAKKLNTFSLSEPYVDLITEKLMVTTSAPIYNKNDLTGVIFFDIPLDDVQELIKSYNPFDAGTIFIVDNSGKIIFGNKNDISGKNLFGDFDSFPLSVSESKTKDKNGVNYDVLIKMSGFGGWNLVSIIDHDKARSDIITLRNNSIFTAVILASVFFAILLFTMRLMLKPLHQLTDAMVNISSGSADLTVRIPNSTDQEFSKIINSFNIFVGNLQSIVSEVKMNSEKINCITTETQELVEVCNNSVADQYRELDMLASSMNEMVATSNQIAQITSEASEITSKINGQVNEGVGAVSSVTESVGNLVEKLDKTKSVIQDLNRQTQNIDVILKAINDIADQTNLLALNAAIEAARAGENGRGFAVVADEVRSLAIKTQESTKNIGSIIHILQENSLLSVHVMDESFNIASETMTISADSKQCLDNISQSVIQIVDITNQVATAAYEQSHVSEEINSNSISIKDKADTLSSLGNKISQQAYSQKALIGHQDDLISKFII